MDRKRLLMAAEDRFDLLVVGGGATGAGVALEAASRGLKTLLVEKHDFSAQTSSRSTKLVHGGVRYLEAAIKRLDRVQWNLVKDALHERAVFLRIAPHLAWKVELLTPLYRVLEIPYILTGLKLYEALAGRERIGRAYFLPPAEAKARFPQIKGEGLKGAVVYADGQFDDARMNLAIVLTALAEGAVVLNHVAAVGFLKEGGRVVGAELEDRLTGARFAARARMVVNATGPFVDRLRQLDDPEAEPLLVTSSGVHLVLPGRYAPAETGLLIPKTEDGRVLFVLPWRGYTLAGTTDEPAEVSEHPVPTKKEIAYILRHLNKHFDLRPDEGEVRSAWSGLRPLVRDPRAADTAQLARDHVIVDGRYGLVTLTGGKWTTFRKMAEDLVDHLEKTHGLKPTKSVSAETPLYGAEGFTPGDLKELEAALPA
ncbi:MAG TPA: FAD-dependent oxidoreductase, partial [Oceanithermus sp.]|nr:FAD-dependent oxidoreductase [Oceanithermus sp.]